MPIVQIEITDQQYARLQETHRKTVLAAPKPEADASPPTFEQWLSHAISGLQGEAGDGVELNGIRAFAAMETVIFSLHRHGFALTHTARNSVQNPQSAQELAESIVGDMQLPPQYVKRVQDLLAHFMKSAKELADAAQIGLTGRSQTALVEAYRLLVERTEKALEHLGGERAIGRVEGGAAILAGLDVMDRDTAKKKTDEFKIKVRTGPYAK